MNSFKIVAIVAVCAFAVHKSFIGVSADVRYDDTNDLTVKAAPARELTPEEEELANEARKHIAKVMENNLVRLFAVIAARGQKKARQEDEGDEAEEAVTANPNVLPQVAQILGAIFSGNLNLTRIADQTVGLVPNLVRNQLQGIVKLLTGQEVQIPSISNILGGATEVPTTPEAPTTKKAPVTTPQPEVLPTYQPISASEKNAAAATAEASTVVSSSGDQTTSKNRYRVRNRSPKPDGVGPANPSVVIEDDEIERLENDLRNAARIYEPYVRDKQPRFFVRPFREILGRVNFNATEIVRAVPSIFQGARQAFVLLESLGVIDGVDEILDDVDLPDLDL